MAGQSGSFDSSQVRWDNCRGYFLPGTAFEASRQPDGSIRLIELVEKEVPLVKVKFNKDGSFECPRLMSRDEIRAAIRASRDAR